MTEQEITDKAIDFAKKNKKQIAKKLTSKEIFLPESHPVSVFMAGSPGAGKTESAKEMIAEFSNGGFILRIDSDELRGEFEDYNGENSSLFQAATSILVDRMHDLALNNKQSFIFDGTLSNLEKTIENIERSLSTKKNRDVFIIYVYQDPIQAWEFVKERALKDGRVVPKEAFIKQYFAARSNVNEIKKRFSDKKKYNKGVHVDLIVKDIDGSNLKYRKNVTDIDSHIKEKYSVDNLNNLLKE